MPTHTEMVSSTKLDKELNEWFDKVDKDHSHEISWKEFEKIAQLESSDGVIHTKSNPFDPETIKHAKKQAKKIFQACDKNGDGKLSQTELDKKLKKHLTEEPWTLGYSKKIKPKHVCIMPWGDHGHEF